MKELLGDTPMPPFQPKSDTSKAAAESVERAAPTLRAKVLACIMGAGDHGRTNEEVAAEINMLLQTVCGRVAELRGQGLIKDSGKQRPTKSGRQATVWVAL